MITGDDISNLGDNVQKDPEAWLREIDMHPDALDETATICLALHVGHLQAGVDPWLSVLGIVALSFQLGWTAATKHSKEAQSWPVI